MFVSLDASWVQPKIIEKPLKSQVHVWAIEFTTIYQLLADFYDSLSVDEQERAHRFSRDHLRDSFVACRGILRLLISKYMNIKPKEIKFDYSEHGKPLISGANLNFNISHTDNRVLLAFCINNEVGIDLETIDRKSDIIGIAKAFFTPEEIEALNSLPESERKLAGFKLWTNKEAFVKTRGQGLRIPLNAFAFNIDLHNQPKLLYFESEINPENWHFANIDCFEKHVATLATYGFSKMPEICKYTYKPNMERL